MCCYNTIYTSSHPRDPPAKLGLMTVVFSLTQVLLGLVTAALVAVPAVLYVTFRRKQATE